METYNDGLCPHCLKEIERPYNIKEEILHILESHPVPLTRSEIRSYLYNGNYGRSRYSIDISPGRLLEILMDINNKTVIQIPDPDDQYEKTHYTTHSRINQHQGMMGLE